MSIADKLTASKNALSSLLTFANAKTGKSDINIGDAIKTLCDGYGQGGGNHELILLESFVFNSETSVNKVSFNTDSYPGYTMYLADLIDVVPSVSDWLYINTRYFAKSSKLNGKSLLTFVIDGELYEPHSSVSIVKTTQKTIDMFWYASDTVFTSGTINIYGIK